MTVAEAVADNLAAMEAAGLFVWPPRQDEIEKFGGLEVLSVKSHKGRRGQVYTVFQTAAGEIGFWPLASCGPRLGPYHRRGSA